MLIKMENRAVVSGADGNRCLFFTSQMLFVFINHLRHPIAVLELGLPSGSPSLDLHQVPDSLFGVSACLAWFRQPLEVALTLL